MSSVCNYKHPLQHSGTGRSDQKNAALDPGSVKLDERTKSDYMLFLHRFSEHVVYYDSTNKPAGDWQAFFDQDDFILLALIGSRDLSGNRRSLHLLKNLVLQSHTPARIETAFNALFELGFYLVREMDGWYKKTVTDTPFRRFLERTITSSFVDGVKALAGLYRGAEARPSLLLRASDSSPYLQGAGLDWKAFKKLKPAPIWYPADFDLTTDSPWETWIESIPENKEAYGPDRSTPGASKPEIIRAGLHKTVSIIEGFLKAIGHIKKELPALIEESLQSHSRHEPHIGLILSFLDLFEYAQDELNSITGRHLDFYYKDVLGIDKKPAVPDKVHMIAEAAKHVNRTMIPKGTLLKAGKDSSGKELFYSTDYDSFINHAQISELRAVEISEDRLWAAPDVRMADGKEEEYEDESAGWHPFRILDKADYSSQLDARIGFAIASTLFELSDGERKITVYVIINGTESDFDLPENAFKLFATGEEGWLELPSPNMEFEGSLLTVKSTLDRDFPPITSFQSDIHQESFTVGKPVLKVVLNQDAAEGIYSSLRDLQIGKVTATVNVTDTRKLIVQNPAGIVDVTRPFLPFGATPAIGSSLLIGSAEIFRKPLTSLDIHLHWKDQAFEKLSDYYNSWSGFDTNNSDYKVKLALLDGGDWKPADGDGDGDEDKIFKDNISDFVPIELKPGLLNKSFSPNLPAFKRFSHDLPRGFVKLTLSAPGDLFGHKLYTKHLADYMKYEDGDTPVVKMPVDPFTPELNSLSVSYNASAKYMPGDGEETEMTVFHLVPFGVHKTGDLQPAGNQKLYLLPHFKPSEKSTAAHFTGEMYIGLNQFEAPGLVSFLAQVKDGTADPEAAAATLSWYYLAKTGWKELKKDQGLRDDTHGFQISGIITADIPNDAEPNQAYPGSERPLIWLKVSTKGNILSIPKLIDLRTQAFRASFTDRDNAPGFLSNPLPAESISKMRNPDASIKSLIQPYSSSGGQSVENDHKFYQRVSERLRHKDRGNSLWDYERMVLEQFPNLYKVKCISHSAYGFEESDKHTIHAEFAPGYVSVLVVPDLHNQNHMNPLEPRVSLGKLEEIKRFLTRKISPFAAEKLMVLNPQFEQIEIELFAKYIGESDEEFNKQRLNNDMIRFLSPWAFGEPEAFRFGHSVHKSIILNFVKNLHYVEYVMDFKMHHFSDNKTEKDTIIAVGTSARSILTSAPSHRILEESTCK